MAVLGISDKMYNGDRVRVGKGSMSKIIKMCIGNVAKQFNLGNIG